METSVVITALNHGSTIIESIESVLSQLRLPDQLGLVLGPSLDETDGMAEFYEEEFDFVHREETVSASDRGLADLRLNSLRHVEGERVLFLRANSYLRREAMDELDEHGSPNNVVLGAATFVDRDGERRTFPPADELTLSAIANAGPLPPGTVAWPRKVLESITPDLRRLRLGPFTTMGWLMVLADRGIEASGLDTALVETWDSRSGPACWTRCTVEALTRLRERVTGDESIRERLSASLERSESDPDSESEGSDVYEWVDETIPLTE
jgi:hypothetical protein